jgi:hypothetical protein
MRDFDRARVYTDSDFIEALEAADLPPLPDDLREMIVNNTPPYKPLVDALVALQAGDCSLIDNLSATSRTIAQRLSGNLSLIFACALEQFREIRRQQWKTAELERKISGNKVH